MALEARRADRRGMFVRRAPVLAATGSVIGLSGALAAIGFLRILLYEVKPSEYSNLGVSTLVVALATLASYLPARRGSRVVSFLWVSPLPLSPDYRQDP
jgi:hypothetical protein